MKKLFVFILSTMMISLFFNSEVLAYAQENTSDELIFLLDKDSVKEELTYINDENETIHLVIESLPTTRAVLSKGTYRVSKSAAGSWSCSYDVTINSSGNVSNASNLNLKALRGKIVSSALTHTSMTAKCDFRQKAGALTSSRSVVATVSGDKLVVK